MCVVPSFISMYKYFHSDVVFTNLSSVLRLCFTLVVLLEKVHSKQNTKVKCSFSTWARLQDSLMICVCMFVDIYKFVCSVYFIYSYVLLGFFFFFLS